MSVPPFSFFRYHEQYTFAPLEETVGERVSVTAQVDDLPETYAGSTLYPLKVIDGGLPAGSRVLFYDSFLKLSLEPGDIVEGTFTVAYACEPTDITSYIYAKAADSLIRIEPYGAITISTPAKRTFRLALLDFRLYIRQGLSHYFTDDTAGLLGAISFGDRQMLTDDVIADYKTVGLSHILAVSGLHLSVVTEMLYRLFRRLRLRKRLASAISIGFVLLFMAMTGFSASVMRAGIMTILVLVARLLFREPDGLNSVGLAILLMTVLQPYAVWDIGLQLSASATLGLLVVLPHWQQWWDDFRDFHYGHLADRWYVRCLRWVGDNLLVTAAATVPTLIPILLHYGEISLLTPVVNLVAVGLTNLLVPLGLVVGLLFGIIGLPTWLVSLIGIPTGLLVGLQNGMVALFADLPLTSVSVDGWFPIVWVAGTLALLLLSRRSLWRNRLLVGSCIGCLLLGILADRLTTPPQSIYALSVGEDVAICLQYQGKTGVVASLHQKDAVYSLKNALARIDVDELAFLMITDLDGEGLRAVDILLHDIPTDRVMTTPTGNYLPELIAKVGEDQLICHTEDPVRVWDIGIVIRQGEWTWIEWGEVTLLVAASPNATAENVPYHLRDVDTLVYPSSPPADWSVLDAEQMIVTTHWTTEECIVRTTAYQTDCLL